MSSGTLLLTALTAQRLIELRIAATHTRRLLARGAYEVGADHYPVMIALHAAWLITLWIFGWSRSVAPLLLVPFLFLQAMRLWVIRTLGPRWTTRVIIVPNVAPIITGPFRIVRHPNYLVVAFELPCVSLMLGLVWHALLFGSLNLAMLAWRVRVENAALEHGTRSLARAPRRSR